MKKMTRWLSLLLAVGMLLSLLTACGTVLEAYQAAYEDISARRSN